MNDFSYLNLHEEQRKSCHCENSLEGGPQLTGAICVVNQTQRKDEETSAWFVILH
jgi:hypothetical protein